MTRKGIFGLALCAIVLVVAAQPAEAACSNNRTFFGQNDVSGYYSYLVADADWAYYTGSNPSGSDIGSSVSSALAGSFWHLGNGNPALMSGNDNGAYEALYGWVDPQPPYDGNLRGDWAGTNDIDGCIDVSAGGPEARCMAIFLQDIDADGAAVFALMTAPANPNGNYEFDQPGGDAVAGTGQIVFAPLPALTINDTDDTGDTSVSVLVQGPSDLDLAATGGYYLNETGDCADPAKVVVNPIAGYKTYQCVLPNGSPAPAVTDPCWTAVDDVMYATGAESTANVSCADAPPGPEEFDEVYLTYRLVLDGGFELPFGAGGTMETSPPRVACGGTLAVDPQDRIRIRKDGLRQRPTTRR